MSASSDVTNTPSRLGAPLGATPFGEPSHLGVYQGSLTLQQLAQDGVITPLALATTLSVLRLSGERDERVAIALALAQVALQLGHLGLRLEHISRDFSPEILRELWERQYAESYQDELTLSNHPLSAVRQPPSIDWSELPSLDDWLLLLRQSSAVWSTNQAKRSRPFVLDGDVLFTYKAWRGESRVTRALGRLISEDVGILPHPERLWARLFAEDERCWFDGDPKWDRARASLYTALRGSFTVIHGGPGTGKTTLTQRILAALIEQYGRAEAPLKIAVTAPTGKAAQRLTESIRARAPFFHLPEEIQAQLEELQGVTLHSLLGIAPGRRPAYHAKCPLPYDVVVVDECSMVDLWLLQTLVEAIDQAREGVEKRRLLLIGDPHQLPSVSAGAPFTELCGARGSQVSPHFTREASYFLQHQRLPTDPKLSREEVSLSDGVLSATLRDLQAHMIGDLKSPTLERGRLLDRVVALNQVRRVSADSGIHAAATAIQRVDELGARAVLECFRDARYADTELYEAPPFPRQLLEEVVAHARRGVSLARLDPAQALQHLKALCLLSPHYGGPLGVNELNDTIEEQLRSQRSGGWGRGYVGRPLLITQNHPPTGLVNGDIGIVGSGHWVHFEGRDTPIKLGQLPPHRTVFAMSIHKSQGSEFKKVIMCIPPDRSPIMTRELIYTGLTRAKESAVIVGQGEVLAESVIARVERGGQLSQRLTEAERTPRPLGERI